MPRFLLLIISVLCSFSFAYEEKLASSKHRLEQSTTETSPYQVTIKGRTYWADPGVFSPKYFKSTEIQTYALPLRENENFLEVGTGVGVTAIIAAREYYNRVVALDINPIAVELTRKNATAHQAKVDARISNVFSALKAGETFDTIYWDLPYIYVPNERECSTMLLKSVCDPGYTALDKFLGKVRNHLNPDGRIILGFSSHGDEVRFNRMLDKYGFRKELINDQFSDIRGGMHYYLFIILEKNPNQRLRSST